MPRARLFGLGIDEVSSVDADANGHAHIMISKRDDGQGARMPRIFDARENPDDLDISQLEFGDEILVLDEAGSTQVLEWMSPEDAEAAEREFSELDERQPADAADERELESVGKGRSGLSALISKRAAAAPAKSLGETVLVQLSKALNDNERDEIVSKALEVSDRRVVAAEAAATEAVAIAKRLQNNHELEQYAKVASDLDIPGDPGEIGEIFQAVSKVLSPSQLDTFERVVTLAGEVSKYDELGSAGGGRPSGVMDQLTAAVDSVISKADITKEQAMVALLDTNPDAYDQYCEEQGTYR